MKRIFRYLRDYSTEVDEINQLLVSTFIYTNKLTVSHNTLIKELNTLSTESEVLISFSKLITEDYGNFSIELLIELFEFVISPIDKEVNGAVYTPSRIRQYLVESALSNYPIEEWGSLRYADISCGCGGFFVSLAEYIRKHTDVSLEHLYPFFYGIDIEVYSIERAKILLTLYALLNGEDVLEMKFNLWQGNSLSFDWSKLDCFNAEEPGFDIVLGNPPYVTSARISEESKKYISRWKVTSSGKVDLYIPFTQIGIEILKPYGFLGYITVNNFYRSLNGRALRNYLSDVRYTLSIIDFSGEQVFKNRATYTCLFMLEKINGQILYTRCGSNDLKSSEKIEFTTINYEDLDDYKGWQLHQPNVLDIINRIQSIGISLGEYCSIRNGFATLKNDVYILNCIDEDTDYYYTETKDKRIFKIEKNICRDVVKPNILHSEEDLSSHLEKLVFPYHKKDGKTIIMSESFLSKNFPFTHEYFLTHKEILAKRDKGCKLYEEWFAFGRTQALDVSGNKLFFPYLSDKPRFVLSDNVDLLFYNGYALVSDDMRKLMVLKRVLSSSIFWFYISHTSKPYGSKFFSLAKNYIKDFGIPIMTLQEEEFLLQLKSQDEVDCFLQKWYNIDMN